MGSRAMGSGSRMPLGWAWLLGGLALWMGVVSPRAWQRPEATRSGRILVVADAAPTRVGRAPLSEDPLSRLVAPRVVRSVAPPVADRVRTEVDGQALWSLPAAPEWPVETRSRRRVLSSHELQLPVPHPLQASARPSPLGWPYPLQLVQELEVLAAVAECADWAGDVLSALDRLGRLQGLSDPQAEEVLSRLRRLVAEGAERPDPLEPTERIAWIRARYALERRLAVWEAVYRLAARDGQLAAVSVGGEAGRVDPLARGLDLVEGRLRGARNGEGWRRYLRLDELRELGEADDGSGQLEALSQQVLARTHSPHLTEAQAGAMATAPFIGFLTTLRGLAARPLQYRRLLAQLERCEALGDSGDAAEVASAFHALQWAGVPEGWPVAQAIESHYRNANFRMAVSEQLLNVMLSAPRDFREPVNDEILGARVLGRSRGQTRLQVDLQPAADRWQLRLLAHGQVTSRTSSTRGPATFFHLGASHYRAATDLQLERRGLSLGQSRASAGNRSQLRGLETSFDGIPGLNLLVRSVALQQYDQNAALANQEVEGKLARRAASQLSREVDQQVAQLQNRFENEVLHRLHRLGLSPRAVELATTEQRLVLRARLAGAGQLGAFQPRPQAPRDSLLSFQLHESAINNSLAGFGLDGFQGDLRTAYQRILEKLEVDQAVPDDVPADVRLRLHEQDAVRVRFDENAVVIRLRVAELQTGRHRWRDFTIRAVFEPVTGERLAFLQRQQPVSVESRSLRFGDRIAIRAIFSKAFSQTLKVPLMPPRLEAEAALAATRIHQLAIRDGWIGLALGPRPGAAVETPSEQRTAHGPAQGRRDGAVWTH